MARRRTKIRKWGTFLLQVAHSNLKSERVRPYKLNFSVSKKCNSKCLNCLNWKAPNDDDLTLDEIKKFAQSASDLSWINFTGGEPSERQDLAEVVRAFIDACPNLLFVHIPTNGIHTKRITALARALIEMQAPGLFFTVSIDGPPEVNDKLRGVRSDFELAVETYKQLKNLGLKVMVGMTLYKENQHLIDQTVEEISKRVPKFNHRDIHVNLPHVSKHFYGNDGLGLSVSDQMLNSISQYRKKRGLSRTPIDVIESWYQRKAAQFVKTGKTPVSCVALKSSLSLAENGTVYPCTMWGEAVGNIRETDYQLKTLLNSPRKKELRTLIEEKKCDNCWSPCEAYQTLLGNVTKFHG